jgi:hypothetical protein
MANVTQISERATELVEEVLQAITIPTYFRVELTVDEQAHQRGKPLPYLLVADQLIREFELKTVIEIGSMRAPLTHSLADFNPRCCNEGHSSLLLANTGANVITIDVDPRCAAILGQSKANFPNLQAITADGIEFLRNFQGSIDFLYLDAWDVVKGTDYAQKHLLAYQAALPRLSPTCVVQIDDTDIMNGGKGRLVIPQLIRDGFELITWGRQAILVRD